MVILEVITAAAALVAATASTYLAVTAIQQARRPVVKVHRRPVESLRPGVGTIAFDADERPVTSEITVDATILADLLREVGAPDAYDVNARAGTYSVTYVRTA